METKLREWRLDDVQSLVLFADNASVAAYMSDGFPHPYSAEAAQRFIKSALEADPSHTIMRAVDIGGNAVGSIGVYRQADIYRKSATIAYWLGEPYWGKGIMPAAIKRMCDLAFEKLDIVRIYAEPFAHNTGSCRVLVKAGFMLEGIHHKSIYKNGILGDSCTYARLK